jgi:hypothetical protein
LAAGDAGPWTDAIRASGFQPRMALNQLFSNGSKPQVLCTYPGLAGYILYDETVPIIANLLAKW